ncbi:unnamed protein product [Cylindrotheca closterium]|uniref:Uncharacterized protein n=1 Tax=Cylindrotheca closterium TaxID=2856 RepID=A0AAD2FUE6_9STRA|nr:unnamed protein product [Cylindrotheca closterium]
MYAQQRQMRYSPHNGPGYYEDQRRYQGSGYSQTGYSQAGYSHAGYSQQGHSQQGHSQGGWDHRSFVSGAHGHQGYGQPYANRHSPVPTYGTRSPSPQWTEQQSARYNQNMNNSPVPTSARDTPVSNGDMDHSSTIDSYDQEDYAATTYTVSEEEPAANVSCTNLLFGGGKKKAGLINCNQVDPSTTEVEVNLNMPRMEHLEKRVDHYMNQVPSSQSNLRAAVQAFHCKQEPIHTHQFAQYARYDYDTYYEEPDYIQNAFQPQMMMPPTPRQPVPAQIYGSALFSEGSASTEDEEEPVPVQRFQNKRAPREIIVDNHDTVSVLSDKHLVNMGIGPSPRHQSNYGNDEAMKPFSPTNRASPRTPSRSKGFRDYNEIPPMQARAIDENGLKKDSESSSLVPTYPDENTPRRQEKSKLVEKPVVVQRAVYRSNDNRSFDESVEVSVFQKRTDYGRSTKKQTYEYSESPSFDEPVQVRAKPETKYEPKDENPSFDESVEPMIRPRKKAELLINEYENDRTALRSTRNHMLKERTETSSNFSRPRVEAQRSRYVVDELMGKSESSEEDVLGKPREKTWDELMGTMDDTKILEDELMGKSRGKPEDMSMGMRGQSVMADSEKYHEMSSSVPDRDVDDRVTRTPSIESNIDAILEKIDNEQFEAEEETVGEEVDYMPSTRAAASLIESMMGSLTKKPLQKIAEDEDFEAGMDALNLDDDEEIKQMKKDLYRFL